ncbi:hypothetical protein HDV05_000031 [Chytridiales sp. JEL 0842]|nr:hypothetical protein HDV05_000031 [Chytridiales sp. JEL 0842]
MKETRTIHDLDQPKHEKGGGGIAGSGSGEVPGKKPEETIGTDLQLKDISSIFDTLLPTDAKLAKLARFIPKVSQLIFSDLAVTAAPDALLQIIVILHEETLSSVALTAGPEGNRLSPGTFRYLWERCSNLVELRIEGVNFAEWDSRSFPILRTQHKLQKLVIENCGLVYPNVEAPSVLPVLLSHCSSLQTLELSDAHLATWEIGDTLRWVTQWLESLPSSLKHVKISCKYMESLEIANDFIPFLLNRCSRLNTLFIEHGHIRFIDFDGVNLQRVNFLQCLILPGTHLTDHDVRIVSTSYPTLSRFVFTAAPDLFSDVAMRFINENLPRLHILGILTSHSSSTSSCTEIGLRYIVEGNLSLRHFIPPHFQKSVDFDKMIEGDQPSFAIVVQGLLSRLRRRGCRIYHRFDELPLDELGPCFLWKWEDL